MDTISRAELDAVTAAQLAPSKDSLVVTYCSGELCRRSKNAAVRSRGCGRGPGRRLVRNLTARRR